MTPQVSPSEDPSPLRWIEARLAERPQNAGLWYAKGLLLEKAGDLDGARQAFERVLQLHPDHPKALEAQGKLLFRMERYQEAFDGFERLTRQLPNDEEVWYYCGASLLKANRAERALPFYDRALEINPDYSQAIRGRAQATTLLAAAETRPPEEEVPVPVRYTSGPHPPGRPSFADLLQRAETAYYDEDYDVALQAYDDVLERDERRADAWEGKARVLTRLARFSEAAECYARAARVQPRDISFLLQRGRLLREEGRLEDALDSLQAAVEADEASVEAEVERREIASEIRSQKEGGAKRTRSWGKEEPRLQMALPTHIDLLDRALGGGITPGSVILVTGPPGTYKTTLCFWILYQLCLDQGIKGLLITLEQSKSNLIRHLISLGIDPTPAAGTLRILDLAEYRTKLRPKGGRHAWLEVLAQKLEEVHQRGVEVVALDSLEALETLAEFPHRRREFRRLFNLFRRLNLTAFLIAERYELELEGEPVRVVDLPEYLADGVLELTWRWRAGEAEAQRGLRIAKMRDRPHPTSLFYLYWDRGLTMARVLTAPPR